MKRKSSSVETSFHPIITQLLFELDELYIGWNSELIITSGSEHTVAHSRTSLHYATPACAVDIRTWDSSTGRGKVPSPGVQAIEVREVAKAFCELLSIPNSWIEVILESDHIHIEYQPKRTP